MIISFKINQQEVDLINKYLNQYTINSNNQYILFSFKYKNTIVSIYNSLKMVLQGNDCETVYEEFVNNNLINDYYNSNIINESVEVNQLQYDTVGCDEVGVGDFFGGIVATSCFVKKEDVDYLIKLGVKDSKKLNDEKMNKLFPSIIKRVRYATKYLDPKQYNQYYDQYQNSHVLKTLVHNEALVELKNKYLKEINPIVIMDEYCSKKNYDKYLNIINPEQKVNIDIFKTQAESHYIAVACASIIARIYFLKQIEILNKQVQQYNLNILPGNTKEIQSTARKIYNSNKKLLDNLVKKHFITYNKIIGENNE